MQCAVLKSFTFENKGGNGAGVILVDGELNDGEKQIIASDIGLSETAFISVKDKRNFEISFFTPVCEVDLCGHATIAAFFYLGNECYIKGFNETKKVYQHTKSGRLEIDIVFKNGDVDYVLMQQQSPEFYPKISQDEKYRIAKSLNIDVCNMVLCDFEIEPAIVSTGLKDIIIPVRSRKILNDLNVNLNSVNEISHELDVVGYHVYTIEDNKIYARNFAPKVGINEECATGTSNGALGGLLYKNNIIDGKMTVIQGESMNEKSEIFVNIKEAGGKLDVRVGGRAALIKKGKSYFACNFTRKMIK